MVELLKQLLGLNIKLKDNQIHVWQSTDDSHRKNIHELKSVLSSNELTKSKSFKFTHLQDSYIIRQGVLKLLLSNYLKINPEQINYQHNEYGKPELINNDLNIEFNISHSNGVTLYAFILGGVIGVDIEKLDKSLVSSAIAKEFLSPQEYISFINLPKQEQINTFFYTWTKKEALIKAIGKGFSYPVKELSVNIVPSQQIEKVTIKDSSNNINLQAQPLNIHEDYFAALAYDPGIKSFEIFEVPIPNTSVADSHDLCGFETHIRYCIRTQEIFSKKFGSKGC